jgi:hypothetical protein
MISCRVLISCRELISCRLGHPVSREALDTWAMQTQPTRPPVPGTAEAARHQRLQAAGLSQLGPTWTVAPGVSTTSLALEVAADHQVPQSPSQPPPPPHTHARLPGSPNAASCSAGRACSLREPVPPSF